MAIDPRDESTRAWRIDEQNRMAGVELTVFPDPSTPYELSMARFLPSHVSGGRVVITTHLYDEAQQNLEADVTMCWPFPHNGNFSDPDGCAIATGMTPKDHVMSRDSAFSSPNPGPYWLYIGTPQVRLSDVVAGMGLPRGEHATFELFFSPRNLQPPPPPTTDLRDQLQFLRANLAQLVDDVDLILERL